MATGVGPEATADLVPVVEYLDKLAVALRCSPRRDVAEISAASDAVACAAALLRTQEVDAATGPAHLDLVRDAIALARSTVETAKFAARDRFGTPRPGVEEGA